MSREGSADELAETQSATDQSARDVAAPAAAMPRTLGRYRLDNQLGAGGMGAVFAALDVDLERRVAIKVLHAKPGYESRARLFREAKAMARLDHPNVVTIFEVDSAGDTDFVVMELVDGGTLSHWLTSAQRPNREILDAFVAAGRGLAAAHAAGMVHRDFKPHNVLRSRTGRILVTDFGLARESDTVAEPSSGATPAPLVNLTVSGAIVGTPAYMPPEQWASGVITPAVDQFAFCVALWEALSGARPFQGTTLEELRTAIERGPEALDARRIPRRLRSVLRRGLERDPARRWPSMDGLLAALARRRTVLPLALIGAPVIAGLIAVIALRSPDKSTMTPSADPTLDELQRMPIPLGHDALIAAIRRVDDTHYTVPRAVVEQLLRERTELAEGAKVSPAMQDEAMVGFKLFSVRPRSVYAAFGLRNFDLVRAIDGIALTTNEALVDSYKRVRTADVVTIDYLRGDRRQQLVITITPQ